MTHELAIDWPRHSRRLWRCSAGLLILLGAGLVFGSALNLKRLMAVSPELLINVLIALSLIFLSVALWRIRTGAERALRESENRKSAIVDASLDAIVTMDSDGKVTDFNFAAEHIFGYPRQEAIGRPLAELIVPQPLCEPHWQSLACCLQTGEGTALGRRFEMRALHADGHEIPIEVSITRVPGIDPPVFTGTLRDITDRKRAEQALQNQAAELERLVAERTARLTDTVQELEAFSYSVSHDLRAPLRHIGGFVQLLQRQAGSTLDPEAQRCVNMIADSTNEMGRLIDDLLAFARMGRAEMRTATTELEPLVREVIRDLTPECEGRDIHWQISPLPAANADRALLRQVWMNLLSNALKYTRTRSRAEIQIGYQPGPNGEPIYFVRDNGVGFNMAYAQKLFGVFQRLHRAEEFEGTGIGLANVRRIISRHGGRTWAEAKLDAGATFYFSLPASEWHGESTHPTMDKAA